MIGCEPVDPDRLGPIRIDPEDRQEAAERLSAAGLGDLPYIVVNVNASDLLIERRWPADRFVELMEGLLARHDLAVVLTGARRSAPTSASWPARCAARPRGW